MKAFFPNQFLVLIVSDVTQERQILGTMLSEAGYKTIFAIDGRQTLEQLSLTKPDLILIDNTMSELKGFQVCQSVKENLVDRDIPVIFIAASRKTEYLLQAFELGAVDYITKPFSPPELLARLKIHLEDKQTREQLKNVLAELEQLAITDSLTGVPNRRYFFNYAKDEFSRSCRYNDFFSLLMIDIDHFKQINDTYGYAAGDEVLKLVAVTAQNSLRREDCFVRFGGEEFVALLPSTDIEASIVVARRIRQMIADLSLIVRENSLKLTVSIGITTYRKQDRNIDTILKRADDALLQAKSQGRNRCIVNASNENGWWAC